MAAPLLSDGDGPPLPYPRLSDRIIKRAHVQFVLTAATALVLLLVWAGFASIEQVARGSGRVMPQDSNKIVQHYEAASSPRSSRGKATR